MQPPVLGVLPSLPNIQWKTLKRRGHVNGNSINKIKFSSGICTENVCEKAILEVIAKNQFDVLK